MRRELGSGFRRETRGEEPAAQGSGAHSPALEQLVRQWEGLIRSAGRRYGFLSQDEDELRQDLRIRLWRTLERGSENPKDIGSSYVYRIVMSAAVDLLRRHRAERAARMLSLEDAGEIPAPQRHDTDEQEMTAALERALVALPMDRRVVVRMHLDGKHRDEIATLLGWTGARTRNLLYRGLADLKRALEGAGKAEGGGA